MSRALSGARAKLDSALGIASASPSFAQPSKRDSNLCLSLLPLFNFGADPSKVTHADWQRGTRAMGLSQLADDPTVWADLTQMYGDGSAAGKRKWLQSCWSRSPTSSHSSRISPSYCGQSSSRSTTSRRCVPMGCPCRPYGFGRRKQTCDVIAKQEM